MKAELGEGGGKILMGDKTGGGAVDLTSGRSGSSVLECGFQLGFLVQADTYSRIYPQFRLAPDLPEGNYPALSRGMSLYQKCLKL
jgi:hypothetical protein